MQQIIKQMEKWFWCHIDRKMQKFAEHTERKGRWICCFCRYTTSNPQSELIVPKINSMRSFYDSIKQNGKEKSIWEE